MTTSNKQLTKKAYIYLWEGRFLYIGGTIRTRSHAHHALQIGVSSDNPFRMKAGEKRWLDSHGIILAPDRDHECDVPEIGVMYLSLDPETLTAKELHKTLLNGKAFDLLPDKLTIPFANQLNQCLDTPEEIDCITKVVDRFIAELNRDTEPINPVKLQTDKRIEDAIKILKKSIGDPLYLHEIADRVGLSGSRLVHLFKQEIGIPMRRYILWLRLNNAIIEILRNRNLTEAAIQAGFSDSAHFSRIFMRNFGISPSEFLKNSQIIQAFRANPS